MSRKHLTPREEAALNFRDATNQLTERITLPDIAIACGASVNSVERARLDPASKSHRNPPAQWRSAVAELARQRGEKLLKLAESLEREAS
jgi:hypothetical protein